MSDVRVTVNRALYLSALRDAMDWQLSILVTHDPVHGSVVSCCTPESRCAQYRKEAQQLARYRKAYADAGGVVRREPEGRAVSIAELAARPAPESAVTGDTR